MAKICGIFMIAIITLGLIVTVAVLISNISANSAAISNVDIGNGYQQLGGK
jgi:hypothetical protein